MWKKEILIFRWKFLVSKMIVLCARVTSLNKSFYFFRKLIKLDCSFQYTYPSQISIGTRQEFTAIVLPLDVTLTIQAPQSPSWHIAFVPRRPTYSRIYTRRDVLLSTLSSDTESDFIIIKLSHKILI